MKARLAALSLLDRALASIPDMELAASVSVLPDDHQEAIGKLAGELTPTAIREAARVGRVNGGMEQIAIVLTDKCLADCVESLGDNAENPNEAELSEVLPGLIERHGLGMTRLMMASAVAGEAPASVALISLLKNDETIKLPKAEPKFVTTVPVATADDSPEREALRQARKERKKAEQAEAAARRAQATNARRK